MPSPIGSMENVKVFVLYLMQQVGTPMDYITVNEVVMQTDFIAALDFAQAFGDMEDAGLIVGSGKNEAGEVTYTVTDKGLCVVDSMRHKILPSILEESRACALRFLNFRERGVRITCSRTKREGGGFDLYCALIEKDHPLMAITLFADSAESCDRAETQFRKHPETVYRGVVALLSGNVNYLMNG